MNDSGQCYISRGGKRKYYVDEPFIYRYLIENNSVEESEVSIYTQEIKKLVEELLHNKKLGPKTVSKLNLIDYYIDKLL